jgi:hypothetical protein
MGSMVAFVNFRTFAPLVRGAIARNCKLAVCGVVVFEGQWSRPD